MITDKLKSLYIDMPTWEIPVKVDDFLIAIGIKQSNSVYHVAECSPKPRDNKRMIRYNMKVLKSDLTIALSRDNDQKLIPFRWYSRKKKG